MRIFFYYFVSKELGMKNNVTMHRIISPEKARLSITQPICKLCTRVTPVKESQTTVNEHVYMPPVR